MYRLAAEIYRLGPMAVFVDYALWLFSWIMPYHTHTQRQHLFNFFEGVGWGWGVERISLCSGFVQEFYVKMK